MSKVSIIIPVYNEGRTIKQVIDQIKNVDFGKIEKEVIIVDDGSTDKTQKVLKKVNDHAFRIIFKKTNSGKGSAVIEGLNAATGDVITIHDADLEYNPNDIPKLIKPIIEGKTKVVYGSRFKGKIENMTLPRIIANKFLTAFINLLYGSKISDSCTCYKVFDSKMIKKFNLECQGFEVCHEITAKTLRKGYKISELPINYTARSADLGVKSSWKDLVIGIGTILLYRFKKLS